MPILTISDTPHVYELTAPTSAPEVLVFIHGWLLSRQYWKPVIQRLASDYQCLAYDLRGFGDSRRPQTVRPIGSVLVEIPFLRYTPRSQSFAAASHIRESSPPVIEPAQPESQEFQPYSLAAYADDLKTLLQQLNLSRVWVIGHSLGGSIALWSAYLAPDQVQGVICVNAGGGIYLKEEFERFRALGQQIVKFRPKWLSYLPFLDQAFAKANVASQIERQWGRQRLIDFVVADPEAAIGALLETTTESEVHRLPQVVASLKQPVHFIAGQNDDVMEPKYVHHLASFHSSFEPCGRNVTEIPNCGHLAMIECPDQVTNTIREVIGRRGEREGG